MKEYEHDRATVDAWLSNGGAEIVLETLRRRGWDIKIKVKGDWPYMDDVVVVGDRKAACMEISGEKSPWQQAFFAILVDRRYHPIRDGAAASRDWRAEFYLPIFKESDRFYTGSISLCYSAIDEIRTSSEATIARMTAISAAERS